MKHLRISVLLLAITFMIAAAANAQQTARIVAGNGTIETSRGNGWTMLASTDQIQAKDRIRTGVGSFATLELGPGKAVVMGDQTEIQLAQLGRAPAVVLVSGNLKVISDSDMRIDANNTTIEGAGEPFEMDVAARSGRISLTVVRGAVRSGALLIRPAADSFNRTYTVGSFRQRYGQTLQYPNIPVYPYVSVPFQENCAVPANPGYSPSQLIPPMTDPLRPPVHYPVNPFPYRPR